MRELGETFGNAEGAASEVEKELKDAKEEIAGMNKEIAEMGEQRDRLTGMVVSTANTLT